MKRREKFGAKFFLAFVLPQSKKTPRGKIILADKGGERGPEQTSQIAGRRSRFLLQARAGARPLRRVVQ